MDAEGFTLTLGVHLLIAKCQIFTGILTAWMKFRRTLHLAILQHIVVLMCIGFRSHLRMEVIAYQKAGTGE